MLRKCKREDGSRLHKGTIELFNGNKARKVKTVYPLITERFTYVHGQFTVLNNTRALGTQKLSTSKR